MTDLEFRSLAGALSALSVFRNLLSAPPVAALTGFLETPENAGNYGAFTASLAPWDGSFSDFLKEAVLTDENAYIRAAAAGRTPGKAVQINALNELRFLSRLTLLTPGDLNGRLKGLPYLPVFSNDPTDLEALYDAQIKNVGKTGYGVFAKAAMFRWTAQGPLPVPAADGVDLNDLTGYEAERAKVEANLLRLLRGKPAANMLLFGEAGTGKSSTVKALVNRYAPEGLRLIELKKEELCSLPEVMGRIRRDPLKFVIFIDDLSFTQNDDRFSMLKSVLEGAAGAQTENAVIAATSNRRHIIKESFSDRDAADDVHRSDTVNELISLSDRFGLTVYFGKPDKALYLRIVRALAEKYGVDVTPALEAEAEAFALKKGSRSPRAARQFVLSKTE